MYAFLHKTSLRIEFWTNMDGTLVVETEEETIEMPMLWYEIRCMQYEFLGEV